MKWILVFIIVSIAFAAYLLPTNSMVKSAANTILADQGYFVEFESGDFSWFGGQSIEDLHIYRKETPHFVIKVRSLQLNHSLIALLTGRSNGVDGTFELEAFETDRASVHAVHGTFVAYPHQMPLITLYGKSVAEGVDGHFEFYMDQDRVTGKAVNFPARILDPFIPIQASKQLGKTIDFTLSNHLFNFVSGGTSIQGKADFDADQQAITWDLTGIPPSILPLNLPKNEMFTCDGSYSFQTHALEKFSLSSSSIHLNNLTFDGKDDINIATLSSPYAQTIGPLHMILHENGFSLNEQHIHFKTSDHQTVATLDHFPLYYLLLLSETFSPLSLIGEELSGNIHMNGDDVDVQLKGENAKISVAGKKDQETLKLNRPLELSVYKLNSPLAFLHSIQHQEPFILTISSDAVIPLNANMQNLYLKKGRLDIPHFSFEAGDQMVKAFATAAYKNTRHLNVWSTPLFFSADSGNLKLSRFDFLLQENSPCSMWGTIELEKQKLHLSLGVPGSSLLNLFAIKGIDKQQMVVVPIEGSLSNPKIRFNQLATLASSLIAQGTGTVEGVLIGKVLGMVHSHQQKKKIPPPTTTPFPWEKGSRQE